MGLWNRMRRESESGSSSPTLAEVIDKYDLVDVHRDGVGSGVIVVAERPKRLKETLTDLDRAEIGSARPSPFTGAMREDYNPELRGFAGLQKYDMMRKSDATVRGTLLQVKTPLYAARWFVEPHEKNRKKDKTIAEFVEDCLFEYATYSWDDILREALLMLDFGYYAFEKVWENRTIAGKERTVLKKLAPRHPMSVQEWAYDAKGGPSYMRMTSDSTGTDVKIPIDKLLVFTHEKEAGSMEGVSVLRSAFKHWYYKDMLYKIDAIQKERHGIGVPIIKLPPGFTASDRSLAENMGRNLRTNDRAHVVLPPNWEIMFAKLEGQRVDALESAKHHDEEIQKNVLGNLDKQEEEKKQTLFLKSTRSLAQNITNTVNKYLIPQLVDYNFDVKPDEYPHLRVRRIGEWEDMRTMSFTLRNLVGAKLITPDEELEKTLRHEMDMPPADTESRRETVTPQAPGQEGQADGTTDAPGARVGPPRQQPTPPVGVPRSNAGTDRSGG